MVTHHIRWQALIAISGILLMGTLLAFLSTRLESRLVPEAGGTYIEGIASRPEQLNPLFARTPADEDIAGLLFESLLRADERGVLQPQLATEWEISDDGSRYTFFLRDDARWHDGVPFTSADVDFTVRVLQNDVYTRDPAAAQLWRAVEVQTPSPYTVRFVLPPEVAPFAPFLGFATFPVLPAHLLESFPIAELADSSFSRNPVGTGPWRMERVEGERIVLEPSPYARGDHQPLLDRLTLRFYDGSDTMIRDFEAGEIQGMGDVPPDALEGLLATGESTIYPATIDGYTALFFNLNRSPLDRRELREALALGLDRQRLIDVVLRGQALLADSFLSPLHWAYTPDVPRYAYQPDEATQRLDLLGWEDTDGDGQIDQDGVSLTLTLVTSEADPELVAVAQEIARQWGALGIEVEIGALSAARLSQALLDRDFDVLLLATPTGGLPPDPDFYPLWHSSQRGPEGLNYTGFADERADQLLVEARRTLDPELRRALYTEFQQLLSVELAAIPLYYPIYNYAVRDLINNVQIGPMTHPADRFASIADWYIRSRRVLVGRDESAP